MDVSPVDACESCPFSNCPDDVLCQILAKLPVQDVFLNASCTSGSWARVCERIFEDFCGTRKWRAPRHPRGKDARPRAFKWRYVYFKKACRGCGAVGEFGVKTEKSWPTRFYLCRTCAYSKEVQEKLKARFQASGGVFIDEVSVTGAPLLQTTKGKRKGKKRRR